MLTKWGAALGLASAGRVVAGGGPLGDATVWGPVLDWTALGTIAGPLRSGDLAAVTDLGPVGSSGLARYNGADWELQQAIFATVADLTAFGGGGELIGSGAIAIVGTGIETDPAYYYDTATLQWLRMPDGVHYIWQQRSDWLDLGTIPAPQNNDRVDVQTLGTAHSSGVAERHGGTWKLVQGRFASVADMVAFPESVHAGAFAEVKSGGGHDDDSVTYVYQSGAWVRYAALTAGFAWTLSSLRDFSAVGLQDGDYGVLTPSGGQPILLRYKAACTAAYGGTVQAWMTPIAYAGTPIVQAWTDGTESNVTLATQGWTIVNDAGCTVTATGGFQRLASAATATVARLRCMVGTVAAATRFETIFEARASTGGGSTLANPFIVIDGTNGSTFGQCGSTGLGFRDFVFGGPLQTPLRNNAGASLPTLGQTAATCLVRDEGRTVLSSADRDGLPLGNYRRNLQTNAANLVQVAAQGQSGTAGTLDYRGQIITY